MKETGRKDIESSSDTLIIGGREFHSRFILGSGKYSLNLIEAAVKYAGAEIVTLAVRRANTREEEKRKLDEVHYKKVDELIRQYSSKPAKKAKALRDEKESSDLHQEKAKKDFRFWRRAEAK